MRNISRTVWILSLVSFFTDTASEMLYPVMPIYLETIGFSIVLIGILEGVAEATAGLSKGYFGKWSDHSGRRVPFVQVGYALSAISKPMMAVYTYPLWIFLARTTDRLGKGVRTGARDALLSAEATPETKGRVFGFHRTMDTLGAVLGPGLALLYLYFYPQDYRTLFFLAFIPGLLAIFATALLRDKPWQRRPDTPFPHPFSFLRYWKVSPPLYRKIVTGLLVFTLFNSSDVFLLLKAKQAGVSDNHVIGAYIFYNLIYALAAFPLGTLADKTGLKKMLVFGLIIFAAVYFGMSVAVTPPVIMGLFLLYGIYAAATEGIAKAWISNVVAPGDAATAIGTFAGFQSICTMLASAAAGWIWFRFGATATFLLTGCATVAVIIYFAWGLKSDDKV